MSDSDCLCLVVTPLMEAIESIFEYTPPLEVIIEQRVKLI
jgi:hypothetical protein